jgi:hypothetical protein
MLLLCVMVVYHGLAELVQFVFPGRNPYREMFDLPDLAEWMLIITIAIICYAATYVLTSYILMRWDKGHLECRWPWQLNWRLWVPCSLVLVVIRVSGLVDWENAYIIKNIYDQFGVFALLVSAVGIVAAVPPRLRVIGFLFIALCGFVLANRMTALGLIIGTFFFTNRNGRGIGILAILLLCVCGAVVAIGISAARTTVGREQLDSGIGERTQGLVSGLSAKWADVREGVLNDFVYRIDGNSFSAAALGRRQAGYQSAGSVPLKCDFGLVIPKFLSQDKEAKDLIARDSKASVAEHYGFDPAVDYIITVFGFAFCVWGNAGLLFFSIVVGLLLAVVDRPKSGYISLVILLATYGCVILYEQNFRVFIVTARSVCVILLAFGMLEGLHRLVRSVFGRPRRSKVACAAVFVVEQVAQE